MIIAPPSSSPGRWTWTCHSCHLTIPLGASNRCLNCSHTFCAGAPRSGKKPHKPCGSTFDYIGWREWGTWRRDNVPAPSELKAVPLPTKGKKEKMGNCMRDCDFPSQCRWGPRFAAGGVETSLETRMAGSIVQGARDRTKKRAEKEWGSSAGEISEGKETGVRAKLGRGLTFPTLDFKSFKTGLDERFFENETIKEIDETNVTDRAQIEEAVLEDLSEEDDDSSIWDWSIGRRRSLTG